MQPEQEEKYELPARFRLDTPEKVAAADEYQKELAAKVASPFASASAADMERARAARIATHLASELRRLDNEILKATMVNGCDAPALQPILEGRDSIAARLAEAYVAIGRYDLALDVDSREEHKAEHLKILQAIDRDDAHWCDCPPGRDFIKADIVTPDGRHRVLRACQCGSLNAVPIPSHLAEQRAHRRTARQLAGHLSPREAADLLRARGHTHASLIKK